MDISFIKYQWSQHFETLKIHIHYLSLQSVSLLKVAVVDPLTFMLIKIAY